MAKFNREFQLEEPKEETAKNEELNNSDEDKDSLYLDGVHMPVIYDEDPYGFLEYSLEHNLTCVIFTITRTGERANIVAAIPDQQREMVGHFSRQGLYCNVLNLDLDYDFERYFSMFEEVDGL